MVHPVEMAVGSMSAGQLALQMAAVGDELAVVFRPLMTGAELKSMATRKKRIEYSEYNRGEDMNEREAPEERNFKQISKLRI